MALIGNIAEELLAQIASYVTNRKDLLSLVLTSKGFYRAAIRSLYARFDHCMYTHPEKLHCFLRTIIKQPDLATHIKHVSISGRQRRPEFNDIDEWKKWAIEKYRPQLSETDRELFLAASYESFFANVDDVISKLPSEEQAQLALLLHLASNITHLSLTLEKTSISPMDRMLLLLLRDMIDQGQALRKLRTLTTSYYNFNGHIDGGFLLSPISSFFRLPSMRIFRGSACVEADNDAFRGFDCPAGISQVEEIEFHRSAICPIANGKMIEACANLKSFYCDWGGYTVGWSEINWPHLARALRTQAHSLERLILITRRHHDLWPESEEGLVPPLGSLSMMEKLRYIQVPASALVGWDHDRVDNYARLHQVLPTCIENLVLTEWAPEINSQLLYLADVCAATYLNLRSVSLCSSENTSRDESEAIFERFKKSGSNVVFYMEHEREIDHLN